jgi:lipopolysaccharide transport system permease protein
MPDEPAFVAERVLRARRGLAQLDLAELWRFRELFGFLAWRDILLRYKQTYLGVAWAVLQPMLTMVVFTVIFGRFAKFPNHGVRYEVLVLAGILPWQLFANALTESSNSLVASARIISKVYFPRLILPLSAVVSGLLDATIGVLILLAMMALYGVPFRWGLLALPVFFGMAFLAATAAGVWLSALNVRYRDVRYIVPFFTRVGMYVTPVGFLWQDVVPPGWQFWFSLNPLVGVIDGFRWCIFGGAFAPYWPGFWLGLLLSFATLALGLVYFRNTEKTFADLV